MKVLTSFLLTVQQENTKRHKVPEWAGTVAGTRYYKVRNQWTLVPEQNSISYGTCQPRYGTYSTKTL